VLVAIQSVTSISFYVLAMIQQVYMLLLHIVKPQSRILVYSLYRLMFHVSIHIAHIIADGGRSTRSLKQG
jgi:hypothetical protein